MAVNKAREIARLVGTNNLVSLDSDLIDTSYNTKGSTGGSGTMGVYSSIDSLPASASVGDKALITSTNTLYLYNNGWYKIATINSFNPQWITQPNGSYSLAIDGSTTTITVYATDSDDVPITYSAVTDSNFDAFATITHDSDKHNVWTVTPTANTGSYSGSVTFKASDGVNLVQAVSSFTVSFTVEGSANARFYLLADSDGEASATDETGTVTTGAGGSGYKLYADSPYRPNDYSVLFSGGGDTYFVIDSPTSDLSFGTGDFCIEMWIKPNDKGQFALADFRPDETNNNTIGNFQINNGIAYCYINNSLITNTTDLMSADTWHHIALSRTGTDLSIYIDGSRASTATNSTDLGVGKFRLFKAAFASGGVKDGGGCYIRDYKVTKGRGIYSGTSYTVPTSAAVEDSDTALLLWNGGAQTPTHLDRTGKQTLTVTGYFKSNLVAPFDQPKYNISEHGGSVRFFNNGALGFSNDSLFRFGSNSGTIACWVKIIDEGDSNGAYDGGTIFGNFSGSTTSNFMAERFDITSKSNLRFVTNLTDSNATYTNLTATDAINPGVWNWVVFVKNGDYWSLYSNGNLVAGPENKGNTTTLSTSHAMLGGNWGSSTVHRVALDGYISDFTVISRAMDSDFATTIPTSPQTADSDAVVLIGRKPSTLVDTYSYGYWTLANATISTAQQKFPDIKSIYFDGNNDYFYAQNYSKMAIDVEDFCIEHWTYVLDLSVHRWLTRVGSWNNGNNRGYRARILTDGTIRLAASNGTWNSFPVVSNSSAGLITTNTWYHIAMSRYQGVIRLFVNGVEDSDFTVTYTASLNQLGSNGGARTDYAHFGVYYADNTLQAGSFYGYIQDYRFSTGGTPYKTANFTPPSEPLMA